ncbi:MAG: peptide ABC transporter substrate-binding protein [Chloroflexi bacterium]|nr:peptide ABC transporter substrate-binding protein [Chloroflexota bacterium]
MRKNLYLLAALLALVMVAGLACAKPAAAPGGGTVAKEQVFRANLAGEPAQLDPNRASWAGEITVVRQVFDGLFDFNQDLTLKPMVAREIPTEANGGISKDGLTYTFKLRNDVTWSDGKKVVAKDFEYSLKRMLDPTIAADYASFYYDIAGGEEFNSSKETDSAKLKALRDAVGVQAVDESTLKVTLKRPRSTFPQVMALWPAYPIRQDMVEQKGETWTEPATYIGNGPFKMSEWVHQDHITLVANDKYWGTKPKLQKIEIKMITDANQELAGYKNNEMELSRVPVGSEGTVMEDAALSKEIVRGPQLVTFGFQFNVKQAPFDNVKLRQAIATALDRESFINKVRKGVGKPATSWLPPGMPGYDANLGKEYTFNQAKAKQLLTDAGYPDGRGLPEMRFQYSDTASNKVIAEWLQAQMKDNLGISVKLEPMESKAFTQLVNQEKHTWGWFGWGADYPDPDNWLPELFGTGGSQNHTLYSSKEFDDLAKQAMAEPDAAKRLGLWEKAHAVVVRDAPAAFMFYREAFWLKKPRLQDLITTGMDGQIIGDFFYPKSFLVE